MDKTAHLSQSALVHTSFSLNTNAHHLTHLGLHHPRLAWAARTIMPSHSRREAAGNTVKSLWFFQTSGLLQLACVVMMTQCHAIPPHRSPPPPLCNLPIAHAHQPMTMSSTPSQGCPASESTASSQPPAAHTPSDYEQMFDWAPVSLWLEDYSGLKRLFTQWRSEGIDNLASHLQADPQRPGAMHAGVPGAAGQPIHAGSV